MHVGYLILKIQYIAIFVLLILQRVLSLPKPLTPFTNPTYDECQKVSYWTYYDARVKGCSACGDLGQVCCKDPDGNPANYMKCRDSSPCGSNGRCPTVKRLSTVSEAFPECVNNTISGWISKIIPEVVRYPGNGPLNGLKFAAKDIIMVEGHRSSYGNSDWYRTHPPSTGTNPALLELVKMGAKFEGFTQTVEFAYNLYGENWWFGTPRNYLNPCKVPGGSSSGSGSLAGAGIVDFALGTDTGGSVRQPAMNNGIFGIRPSQNRIPTKYVLPLSQDRDTVGWMARDIGVMKKVADVLYDNLAFLDYDKQKPFTCQLYPRDIFNRTDTDVRKVIDDLLERHKKPLEDMFGPMQYIDFHGPLPTRPAEDTGCNGSYRAFENFGPWIRKYKPKLGPQMNATYYNLAFSNCTTKGLDIELDLRAKQVAYGDKVMGKDCIMWLPTATIAPINIVSRVINTNISYSSAVAPTIGTPQIQMPVGFSQAGAVGISIMAPRDQDERMINLAVNITKLFGLKHLEPRY